MKIPYKKIEIPNKIKKHLKIPNKKIKDGVSPALREQRFGRGWRGDALLKLLWSNVVKQRGQKSGQKSYKF